MDTLLKEKVDLMIENFYKLKKNFKWEHTLIKHFSASVHATKKRSVDVFALEDIKKYIKTNTSWTSYFRGINQFTLCTLLYLEEDYKDFFQNTIDLYEKMKNMGFKRSTYLPLAAYTIVKEVPKDKWSDALNRMQDFYESMKRNHFWLTSTDDYVFAAVLATTDLDVSQASEQIENCYTTLNKMGFYKGNDLQTLSHILAIGEESTEEKCNRATKIYHELTNKKIKPRYSGLATLGVLSLITPDVDKLVKEIKEVYDYLYDKSGYGSWSIDKSMRVMLASTLVADFYVEGLKKGVLEVTLSNSINAIIIAQQQAAVAATIAASSAAASSSSS